MKNRRSTLAETNGLGWLKLARIGLRAREEPGVKPRTLYHPTNFVLCSQYSDRIKNYEVSHLYFSFHSLCKALKHARAHTHTHTHTHTHISCTTFVPWFTCYKFNFWRFINQKIVQTFDKSVIFTLGIQRTNRKVRIISWMVADNPYVVSIRVVAIWYLPHVWPEKGISLGSRPDTFVHLQKDQCVICYCFYNGHLLDCCCNT